MSSIAKTKMTEISSIKDKNVFNYKDKIVLKLQEQKCPQIIRITMSLITRTKMSSNYKDKNVPSMQGQK
ncbi:6715_t:CDS:2 [Rhizophagus irregularis]|nr:6715_t:CDS:2 [Rhizophagus irregularis]